MEMRSSLRRVQGLGSAKEGVGHWWALRLTSVALVPLVLWFMVSVVFLVDTDHAAFKAWVGGIMSSWRSARDRRKWISATVCLWGWM